MSNRDVALLIDEDTQNNRKRDNNKKHHGIKKD